MEKIEQTVEDIKEEIGFIKRHKRKLREGCVDDAPPVKRKRGSDEDNEEKPMVLPKTEEKCEVAIERLSDRLKKWEIKREEKVSFCPFLLSLVFFFCLISFPQKDELKTISLSTSKVNYIDPRLSGFISPLSLFPPPLNSHS